MTYNSLTDEEANSTSPSSEEKVYAICNNITYRLLSKECINGWDISIYRAVKPASKEETEVMTLIHTVEFGAQSFHAMVLSVTSDEKLTEEINKSIESFQLRKAEEQLSYISKDGIN